MALDVKVRRFIAHECVAEQKAAKNRAIDQLKRAIQSLRRYDPEPAAGNVGTALVAIGEMIALDDVPDFLKARAEEVDRAQEARLVRGKRRRR